MSIGKMVSLIVGLVAMASVGGVVIGEQMQIWPVLPDSLLTGVLIAGGVGFTVSCLFYAIIGAMFDSGLNRLRRHFDTLGNDELSAPNYKPPFYLRSLSQSACQTLGEMRRRIDQLQGQRRELEIQCRVIDAGRQHAESILQSISDAVLVTDAFNEVAIANEAASQALDFTLEEAKHQPVESLLADPALVKMIRDTRESGNPNIRRHVEHQINHNSRQYTYDVMLSCVSNHQSEVSGVVTILHDITKEKEVSEMKSDFVSSVSHELRTPLSSIKAYVEMLVDGEAEDEKTREEFYNIIQSESNRLSRLIDNILNISRIESGIVEIHRDQVSLPTVIKEVIDVMLPQARAKQIELTVNETPLFYQIHADKDMIYQAILNLVSNAIKYTPEKGSVVIDAQVDDHKRLVMLSVTDTGAGIPADALPHLFEKFYRVKDNNKMAKGTGLGLNLVKHIVETVHGGEISVSSETGKGSTFRFSLPIADGAM